jgi:hypothetical protein
MLLKSNLAANVLSLNVRLVLSAALEAPFEFRTWPLVELHHGFISLVTDSSSSENRDRSVCGTQKYSPCATLTFELRPYAE